MSRLDTQSDRLVSGPGPFERQRSFLVQPQQFATGQVTPISEIVGRLAGAAKGINEIKEAESQDLDNADYISVLEIKNKAETSPEEFGTAYLDSVVSALDNVRTLEGKARLLKLNAGKQITDWQTAQANQQRNQDISALNAAMTEWKVKLDPTNRRYIEANDVERFNLMSEEWNQTLAESPELQRLVDLIENDSIVRAQYLSNIKSASDVYKTSSDTYHSTERNINITASINGAASRFTLDPTHDIEDDVNDISTISNLPPDVVRSDLYSESATQIGNRVQSGQILLKDGLSRLDDIQQKAEGLDDDTAVSQVNKVRTQLIAENVDRSSQAASIGYYEDIASGVPIDEALQEANNILVASLESITGKEIDDDRLISQILAEPGTSNLQAVTGLAAAYGKLLEDAAERTDTRSRSAGPTSSSEMIGRSPLKYYDSDGRPLDPESARLAFIQLAAQETKEAWGSVFSSLPTSDQLALTGQAYGTYASVNFSSDPDRAGFLTEAIENNGPAGMQYSLGAVTNMPNNEFEMFVNDMPEDESYALSVIRDEAMRMNTESLSLSFTPDQLNTLTTSYNTARDRISEALSSRGANGTTSSNNIVFSDNSIKRMAKAAGFEDLLFSQNALNQIRAESSKYGETGPKLGTTESDNMIIRLMSRNGLFYIDPRKNPNEIQYMDVRGLTSGPEAYGVSREKVRDILGPNTNIFYAIGANLLPALIRLGGVGSKSFNYTANPQRTEMLASITERQLRGGLSSTRPTVASRKMYAILQDQFGLAAAWPQTFGVNPDDGDMPRVVAPILSNTINTAYLPPNIAPLTALQIDGLLRSDPEDPGGFLRLDVGTDGVLFAHGRINNVYFQGDQSIPIMDFPPELYQFGQTIPFDVTVDAWATLPSIIDKLPTGPILP